MSIQREVVAGPGVPATIGPYSPAVRAGGVLYVSGQPGIDPETNELSRDFREQAQQAIRNVAAVLGAGGSRLELVVNTTVTVADFADLPVLNDVFAAAFPVDPPARMVMQVPLPLGLLISIGCVAVVDAP